MPDELPVYYWDSSVWISYLNNIPERAPQIDPYVRDIEKSRQTKQGAPPFTIVASTLIVAEVAFVTSEREKRALSEDEEQRIDALLGIAKMMSAHDVVMRDARAMIREALQRQLRIPSGADAVHLATARRWHASEFHTYDAGLLALGSAFGFAIKQP